ncbi:MAG: hypothetical protein LBI59_05000 [Candidatus Accumulibacter sp.]|jgi:hypothetical protein|nr:hypothetical protein [Accumulibacter sp.]
MDIWKWINRLQETLAEAGQESSANLLEDLSSRVCDLEIARAEAILPEAKALAKSLGNPWLEVFVGHWEMRNRLGANLEGEHALPDMVALFERAHREDAIDCPQSVCITQDVSNCYANIDGPGWANERRSIVEETLRHIDPSWDCFLCLSIEYADSLYDEGRFAEGLAWIDAQEAMVRATVRDCDLDSVEMRRAEHLMGLGRDEEALSLFEELAARVEGPEWENTRQARLVRHALALAKTGRDEEAWKMLPDWDATAPRNKTWWIAAAELLLQRAPERNTWGFGSRLQAVLDHYARYGAHRPLVNCAVIAARLALSRNAPWSAQRLLTLARRHQARLRIDAGADEKLGALETELANFPAPALPVPAAQLMEWLEALDERDPEREVQWLLSAQLERPTDQLLLLQTAEALAACGAHEAAETLLWSDLERRADDSVDNVALTLLDSWLKRGDHERIELLACRFDVIEPAFSSWCRARAASRREDWARVIEICRDAMENEDAPRKELVHLLASGLRQQKRFAEAAAAYLRLAELAESSEENPNSALWDHMSCAAAAEDWAAVRNSAGRLELELEGDSGPIDENWGWVIIRLHDNDAVRDYYARRTGPVTARILENAVPGKPQHVLDEIVFDAASLEEAPEDEAERKDFVYTYGLVHTLASGGFGPSWLVEGAHPGEERLKALIDAMEARGYEVWVHHSNYELHDSENDDAPLRGVILTAAIPQTRPARELNDLLQEETRDLPHRLCWLNLAKHCGVDTAWHEACVSRYGL